MAQINFTGNLGGEAKVGFTQSGNAKLEFNVADTKGKKDAQGNWDKEAEQTQWFRCTLWGPDAEYYAERLRKGARVSIYGDLMAREYVDRDGVNRTSLDVTVRGLSVINKRGEAQQPAQQQQQSQGWGGNDQSAGAWGNSQNTQQVTQDGWGNTPSTGQSTGQGGWG